MIQKIKNTPRYLAVIALATAIIPQRLYPQKQSPTVVFYAAYIFEAKSNGDKLEFPLLPGETAIATLDNFSETAPGYIQKLRSIYSFQHFSLLGMLGGSLSIDLRRGDGRSETITILGAKKHLFSLLLSCKSIPQEGLLPIRIEAQLDTLTKPDQKFSDKNRIYLFKTLCTVKTGHPLVIGRPLHARGDQKRAIFVVFTPFFQQLTDANQYDKIVSDYRKVMRLTMGKDDKRGRNIFKKINQYFETNFKNKNLMRYENIISSLPPPPPPPAREDMPVFVPFDEPPVPIGGFEVIQKNLIYPEAARKSEIEGRILVWAKINDLGEVVQTRIMTSLGPGGCDEAAMKAISSVKWRPAIHKDKPVTVWVAVPVDFKLK